MVTLLHFAECKSKQRLRIFVVSGNVKSSCQSAQCCLFWTRLLCTLLAKDSSKKRQYPAHAHKTKQTNVEQWDGTQYVQQRGVFTTHLPESLTPQTPLCISQTQLEINFSALPPIFFFGENLCGFYVRDSSILGEYVTLSVKLYILAGCGNQRTQQKTDSTNTSGGKDYILGEGKSNNKYFRQGHPKKSLAKAPTDILVEVIQQIF